MTDIITIVAPDGTWVITDSATSSALTDRQVAQRFSLKLNGTVLGTSNYFLHILRMWERKLRSKNTNSGLSSPPGAGVPANIISVTYNSIAYVIVDNQPTLPLQSTIVTNRFELTEGAVHKAYERSFYSILRKWWYRINSAHGGI